MLRKIRPDHLWSCVNLSACQEDIVIFIFGTDRLRVEDYIFLPS